MELGPRQLAFVKSEMKAIEEDGNRDPTVRAEAERIRSKADRQLTE
jgi:hypothetical protein